MRYFLKRFTRNIIRRPGFTVLNVLGLAVGLACFGLIMIWVQNERSYDRTHDKAGRLFRMTGRVDTDTETFHQAVTCPPMASALQEDFPEVEAVVRLDQNDAIVRRGDRQFKEDGLLFTDPSFFEVFDFELLRGDAGTALRDPYSVVLTESTAKKYFGDTNPLGEALTIFLYDPAGRGAPYTVTGVVADPPANIHFDFNFLGSFSTAEAAVSWLREPVAWLANFMYTYVLLKEGIDAKALESKLPLFADRHLGDEMDRLKMYYTFALQPVEDIYLHSDLRYEIGPTGDAGYLRVFSLAGLFIVLLACINYMNLATARSVERTHEIGVRKIMGAPRGRLIAQFLGESVGLAFLALGLALIGMELIKPVFYRLTGYEELSLFPVGRIGLLSVAALAAGLLSGLYPALVISGNRIVPALKGTTSSGKHGEPVRKAMVVLQFCVSVGMIIAMLAVQAQMRFMQNKKLGFDKENLMVLRVNGFEEVQSGYPALREALLQQSQVKQATTSGSTIVGGLSNGQVETIDREGRPVSSSIYRLTVGYDYFATHGIELLAGRTFSTEFPADTADSYIVNAAAVEAFGWETPERALGKSIRRGDAEGRVVGVVNNFHFNSLRHPVEPVLIYLRPRSFSQITLRTGPMSPAAAVDLVGKTWKQHFPNAIFDYSFYDERIIGQYEAEARFALFFRWFSGLSLLIACLGLVGLAAFSAERRAKEIGIRKVLGASVRQIVLLLNRDFLRLVFISIIVAAPVAWRAMEQWLNGFAYRIDFEWWMIGLAGLAAVCIAIGAVSVQSVRAALADPVHSLKDE